MKPPPSYVFFTDAAPRLEGGVGGNVLAWNLLQALRPQIALAATHLHNVYRDLGLPLFVYPDLSVRWLRRCLPFPRAIAAFILFLLWLPALVITARRHGCRRILAVCGSDPCFLWQVNWLRRASGLPLDLYLIDDLEESSRIAERTFAVKLAPRLEARTLRKADRVFTISPGYAEHLLAKYGQAATWLPVPAEPGNGYAPYQQSEPDRRAIVFLGSINALYLDSLAELYRQIARWNDAPDRPYELCLRLFTRYQPQALLALLPDHKHLELRLDATAAELHDALRQAWSIFLPYSFAPDMRVMVSTSFSHKFTESIGAGRPILVYGPAEASLPRYFRENHLPLCATTPDELSQALHKLSTQDRPELIEHYQTLARRHHSPAALRAILFGEE